MSGKPSIPFRRLGGSGLYVSELGLGAMTFSTDGKGGWGLPAASEEDSHAILDAYVAAGGNFFDTADVYHTSEACLGRWLAKRQSSDPSFRQSIVIATKVSSSLSVLSPLTQSVSPSLLCSVRLVESASQSRRTD